MKARTLPYIDCCRATNYDSLATAMARLATPHVGLGLWSSVLPLLYWVDALLARHNTDSTHEFALLPLSCFLPP